MLAILLFLLLAASSAGASTVFVQYPLQDQLPLIARINAPYSWTFSSNTFVSSNNVSLQYTTSSMPAWLSFDNSTLTLHGTPAPTDEGTPSFHVTATDPVSSDSASSYMTLCVTPYAAPQLHIPVTEQFYAANPSLSSVFLLSPDSALDASKPALRIPPKWSFSVGFLYDTFTSRGDLYYAALQADGSPLPPWVDFSADTITFNGVTPPMQNDSGPMTVSIALHASDQEGYSASSIPFDLIVAAHELSLSMPSLPTINITAATPFNFSLTSPDDFSGVLIDGEPVGPSDIVDLAIDTSDYRNWLRYDPNTRSLSGKPPDGLDNGGHNPVLPVTLMSSVNQSIETNVSLAVVPSYFSTATLQPILVLPGQDLSFSLAEYFSNSTGLGNQSNDVNLTAAFDPEEAGNYLKFDPGSAQLTGTIPTNVTLSGNNYTHITVTFTAYSHVTHSTSHTSLPISLSDSDYANQHTGGLSAAARKKLLLGLVIGSSIIGSLVGLGFTLATVRRCARVPDTAVQGEEGTHAWTTDEMKWYGIGIEVGGKAVDGPKDEGGYGWTDGLSSPGKDSHREPNDKHSRLGVGLQRVLTRTISNPRSIFSPILSPRSLPQSPGVMRKGEFIGKVRATARIVSDKYKGVSDMYRRSINRRKRPVISKPTLIMASDNRVSAMAGVPIEGLPVTSGHDILNFPPRSHPDAIPFEDMDLSQYAPSGITSVAASPSSSTDERSIPRRRADFAPPKACKSLKAPLQAHLKGEHAPKRSVDSAASGVSSLASNASSRTHAAEAVVQTAARATSVRSARSASALSFNSQNEKSKVTEGGRPRLVPFTSASRVPVPKLPSALLVEDPDAPVAGSVQNANGGAMTKRVASQVAKVFRNAAGVDRKRTGEDKERSADDLSTGMRYVRALGDDTQSATSLGE